MALVEVRVSAAAEVAAWEESLSRVVVGEEEVRLGDLAACGEEVVGGEEGGSTSIGVDIVKLIRRS